MPRSKVRASLETIAGKGFFVRANHSPFKKEVGLKLLAEAIDDAVVKRTICGSAGRLRQVGQ